MELSFPEDRDDLMELQQRQSRILRVHSNDARKEFSDLFRWLLYLCGMSQDEVVAQAPRVREMLIADGYLDEDEKVGGIGAANTLSKCLSMQQTPGRNMLIIWIMTIRFYYHSPEVEAEVLEQTKQHLPRWDVDRGYLHAVEEHLYKVCGYCMPEEQYDAYEWCHYDGNVRPDMRFTKKREERFSRISGQLPKPPKVYSPSHEWLNAPMYETEQPTSQHDTDPERNFEHLDNIIPYRRPEAQQ